MASLNIYLVILPNQVFNPGVKKDSRPLTLPLGGK